ncbi:hypothetical protein KEM60_02842 [Austwickia sp. TVS 96-490-7B]|uniref:YwiC-like family protein n=1 Tax=Austwickia sp. TVS 96-490-7B TaxID=2830843 RepID=UPI001C55CDAB|nr:YwiC-like family protein [Austwickia sp. TVS 96-490-7B]MBW3086613.1 hypothetical protein [Austwickia sp. TVS 96-490-7B]
MTARRSRRIPAQWLPRQHGAWAMLAVPAAVGSLRGGASGIHLLLVTWLFAGYFLFNAAGLAARVRGRGRDISAYLPALSTYGTIAAILGAAVVWYRPWLLLWLPVYLPLAAISLLHSWRRQDRALTNDAVTIAAACLFAGVAFQAGDQGAPWLQQAAGRDWSSMVAVIAALLGYFFGTALYVKTMIRERLNRSYRRWSIGYHLAWTACWPVALWLGAPVPVGTAVQLTVFCAVLTARAAVLAGRRVRPAVVGVGEIVASVVLLMITVWW